MPGAKNCDVMLHFADVVTVYASARKPHSGLHSGAQDISLKEGSKTLRFNPGVTQDGKNTGALLFHVWTYRDYGSRRGGRRSKGRWR